MGTVQVEYSYQLLMQSLSAIAYAEKNTMSTQLRRNLKNIVVN